MKIFGKRKAGTAAASSDATAEKKSSPTAERENDRVKSYFSPDATNAGGSAKKKKKQRTAAATPTIKGDDIQALLAMAPSELNAKQRRLVRRHKEREGGGAAPAQDDTSSVANSDEATEATQKDAGARAEPGGEGRSKDTTAKKDSAATDAPAATEQKGCRTEEKHAAVAATPSSSASETDIADILQKLEGLNSKDRRKYLRQLRSSSGGAIDEKVIAAAEERAKKVAERNENAGAAAGGGGGGNAHSQKGKSADEGNAAAGKEREEGAPSPKKKTRRRRKGPPVDLDALPPDERARREAQRRMQVEAAERRAAGLVDPTRHPLNSERRRANRRKPSKTALIAMRKKEELAERGRFNAVGYQMRRGGGGGGGGDDGDGGEN